MDRRPPLGVMPKYVHDQHRMSDLFNAVLRYMTEGCKLPKEWIAEIDKLLNEYSEDKRDG